MQKVGVTDDSRSPAVPPTRSIDVSGGQESARGLASCLFEKVKRPPLLFPPLPPLPPPTAVKSRRLTDKQDLRSGCSK
eukprot:superscaffoldBa00002624_g14830